MAENNLSSAGSSGPNLWSYGQYQVGVWVDASFHVMVGIRTHTYSGGGRFDTKFDLSTLPALRSAWSNTITTAANPLGVVSDDNHETPAMALDGDGFIHVARYIHIPSIDAIPRLIRSKFAVDDPAFVLDDPTQWVDEAADITDPLDGYHEYNYFAPFPNGDLLLMHATRIILPGSGGASQPSWQWCYVKRVGQTHWTNRGVVAQGGAHGAANQDAFYINCPYISQRDPLDVNSSRIHLFGSWSGQHSGGGAAAAVIGEHSYIYSDDAGVTWRNVAGAAMTLPFSKASGAAARTGPTPYPNPTLAPPAWGGTFGTDEDDNIYSFGCTVDGNGRPCGSYSKRTPARAAGTGTFDTATVASYARAGNVVTLGINGNPFTLGWVAGDTIVVSTGVPAFDGTFILTAVTTTSASYAQTGPNVATTANSGTVLHYSTLPANDPGAPGPIGHHVIRWNGAAWIQDSSANYFGGGQLLNLLNFRNDVFLLARKDTSIELRRLAAPADTIKIAGPVSAAVAGSATFPSGRHPWADPIVLRDLDRIDVLTTDFDVPRVASHGGSARYRPASSTPTLPTLNGGSHVGNGMTAWAVINDAIVPTTIDPTGTNEVGMVGQFNTTFNLYAYLRSLPPSTRVKLQPGATYWCDRNIEIDTTQNLIIDLNGAELQARTDKPFLPINPDQTVHDANWTANRNRWQLNFIDCDHILVLLNGGAIRGANTDGGSDGATDPNLEAQASIHFYGTHHGEVAGPGELVDAWGDGVFMQRNFVSGRNCTDIYVHAVDIHGCARHGICPTGVIGWRVISNRIFDIRRHIIDVEPNDGSASVTGGLVFNNDIGYGQLGYLSIATYGAVATIVGDNVFDMNRCTFVDPRHPAVQPGVTLHVNIDWGLGTVRMGDTTIRNHVTNRPPGFGTGSPGHGIWDKANVTAYSRTGNVATLTVNINPLTRGWGPEPDALRIATGNAAFDTAPNTTVPLTARTATTVSYANNGPDVPTTPVNGTMQHETPGTFGVDIPAMIQAIHIANLTVVGLRSLDGNPPMLQPANGMWVVWARNHAILEVHGNETAGGAGELHDWNNP